MQRIPVATNFFLDEFVPPSTFFKTFDHGLAIVDTKLFEIAQLLRTKYGKSIGINNWWAYYLENKDTMPLDDIIKNIETKTKLVWNKKLQTVYKWSGYRPPHCPIGAPASAHKLGKGIDPKGPETELMQIVRNNIKEFYALGLRRLEDIKITPGWLHMDTHTHNTIPNHVNVVDLKSVVERIKAQ